MWTGSTFCDIHILFLAVPYYTRKLLKYRTTPAQPIMQLPH
jgi:hypothetical protein